MDRPEIDFPLALLLEIFRLADRNAEPLAMPPDDLAYGTGRYPRLPKPRED